MTDYTDLIHRLNTAAEDMRRGVHTPAHIAIMLEAATAIYDLTHPTNRTLLPDKEVNDVQGKN